MIVVSDTTPLISLMKIGRLGLVEQLFESIQPGYLMINGRRDLGVL